jgi:hypothetical protein
MVMVAAGADFAFGTRRGLAGEDGLGAAEEGSTDGLAGGVDSADGSVEGEAADGGESWLTVGSGASAGVAEHDTASRTTAPTTVTRKLKATRELRRHHPVLGKGFPLVLAKIIMANPSVAEKLLPRRKSGHLST